MVNINSRGRPKLPDSERKVLFAKRVHPSKVSELLAILSKKHGEFSPAYKDEVIGAKPEKVVFVASKDLPKDDYQKVQVLALLDDVAKLTSDIEGYRIKLERCSRASEDEKFRVLLMKYDQAVNKLKEKEDLG